MINMNVDMKDILDLLNIDKIATKALAKAAATLTQMTKAHIIEEANKKLHTRRQMFIDGLSTYEEDGVWVVSLAAKVRWIDDGLPDRNMLDDLLKSQKAKRGKDGSTYISIPFQHNKAKQLQTPAQRDLIATIRNELSSVGIKMNEIVKDKNGRPKQGLVHSIDIMKEPVKTQEGPGMGKGPIGQVRQGNTGIPHLKGVQIYQKNVKDRHGNEKTQRSIMTFRMASSKQIGSGKWDMPELAATNIMEDSAEWALKQWKEKIAPSIIDQISIELTG